MNELKAELDRYMGSYRGNPVSEEKMYDFLQSLSEEGKLLDYTEQDWIEAGKSRGLSDDEIAHWIETAASWIDDTTEEGEFDPEPSFWAEMKKFSSNPAVRYPKGSEIEDCACDDGCTCDPCSCDECEDCKNCLCCCQCEEEEDCKECCDSEDCETCAQCEHCTGHCCQCSDGGEEE